MTQVVPQPTRRDGGSGAGPGNAPRGRRALAHPDDEAAAPQRGRHATAHDQGFGRVVGWTILGGLLPGAGLLAAGRRGAGRLLLGGTLAVAATAAWFLVAGPRDAALRFVLDPDHLLMVAVGIVLVALLWAAVLLGTHVSLRRFASLTGAQRALSTTLVGAMVAGGGLVAAKAADYSLLGRDTLQAITRNGTRITEGPKPKQAADPWAGFPGGRVNVLLVGSDAGADRVGVRPDTLIVASIDTRTGDTVLVSLPRNLQHVPFPADSPGAREYPGGFACTDAKGTGQCLLNALWQYGEQHRDDPYYKDASIANPGLKATVDGVTAVTGLRINEYALLNLKGFIDFVNAVGGLRINVERPIPVSALPRPGGGYYPPKYYIQPGLQRLDGFNAEWYARSRSDSDDFDRMKRQRCVIGALTAQADPATVVAAFPEIARSASQNISTSIRPADFGAWITLAQKVKGAHVRSLAFTDAVIDTARPDFAAMHALVEKALTAKKKAKKKGTTTAASDPRQAVDVNDVCG